MAIGIWTIVDHAYMEQLLGTNLYMSAAYILIATGIIVILVSFFGCMGAVKEIKCMLLTVSASIESSMQSDIGPDSILCEYIQQPLKHSSIYADLY